MPRTHKRRAGLSPPMAGARRRYTRTRKASGVRRGGFLGPALAMGAAALAPSVYNTIESLIRGRHNGGAMMAGRRRRRHSKMPMPVAGRRSHGKGSAMMKARMAKLRAMRHGGAIVTPGPLL